MIFAGRVHRAAIGGVKGVSGLSFQEKGLRSRLEGIGIRAVSGALWLLMIAVVGLDSDGLEAQRSTYPQIEVRQYSFEEVPRLVARSLNKPLLRSIRVGSTQWQVHDGKLLSTAVGGKHAAAISGQDGLPVRTLTGLITDGQGGIWIASTQGVVLFRPDASRGRRWFYFASIRYLGDDEVLGIVPDHGAGGAWVRTRASITRISLQPFSLAEKSALFLDRIELRHNRYGYVGDCDLTRAGDLGSFRMAPQDNDGLWTSLYVASETFRYRSTGDTTALLHAQRGLRAMLRLVSITGIEGLPARSLIHKGDYRDPGGEWHWTADGEWEWKGDTSSDELAGHFFAYWIAYNLLPDEGDRAAIRAAVASIAAGLIDNHWQLVGYDHHVTTWGRYDPEYLNGAGREDRALDSLELLSHLSVAYWITGDAKFLKALQQLRDQSGYLENLSHIGDRAGDLTGDINYSDEELAFVSFYPLLEGEKDPALHRAYASALSKEWQQVRKEHNPLWNFMYAHGTGDKQYEAETSLEMLERIPLSTISWTVKNSQRDDLRFVTRKGRFGEAEAQTALLPDQRAVMKWNANPFQLDGGNAGLSEDDGTFFLLPYWMGRYYKLLPSEAVEQR